MEFLRRAWAEIDLDALEFNLGQIRKTAPEKEVIAVVKANAYGHSDKIVCKEYYRLGVRFFAVSNVREAQTVRELLPYEDVKILVFGYIMPPYFDLILSLDLIATAGSVSYARELSEFALKNNTKIKVHINYDTGMSRVGVETEAEVDEILSLKGLEVLAGYSHFAVSDCLGEKEIEFTDDQERKLSAMFVRRKLPFHSQASGGITFHSDYPGSYLRPGLILYGCSPNTSVKNPIELRQVMTLKSEINQLKLVKKGISIGYGRTYTPDSDQLIALIPIGYADGYSRLLSNKGLVAVNGTLCPIRGRVCMDQLMIDVSDVPDVKVGDEVLLYSDKFRETSLDYIADVTGTISNETICAVSARVPRVAIRDGKIVEVVVER